MAKIYAFCNQKGGVGKTTTVVNLATVLAQSGLRGLVVDFDPQGNATSGLGINKAELSKTVYDFLLNDASLEEITQPTAVATLSVLPARTELAGAEIELVSEIGREFILKNKLLQHTDKYDFMFIDCPPSLGLMTINALAAASRLYVPLQCEYYALEGLSELLRTYDLVKAKLNAQLRLGGVILTMADFRNNLTQEVIKEVKQYFGDKVFKTIIPRSVRLSEAPSYGKPGVVHEPSAKGAKAYIALGQEVIKREGFDIESQQSKTATQPDVQEASIAEGGESHE